MESVRISRRNFLKLNAIVGSALAVTVVLPAAAAVAAGAASPIAPDATSDVDDLVSLAPALRYGTPTDVAATWPGDAWSVDAEGVIRRFDRVARAWLPDGADEADFPAGSQLVLARWGRPSGPNQMLMVLAS